jgi:hypothetical protein
MCASGLWLQILGYHEDAESGWCTRVTVDERSRGRPRLQNCYEMHYAGSLASRRQLFDQLSLLIARGDHGIYTSPLKPSGNYMYHLL